MRRDRAILNNQEDEETMRKFLVRASLTCALVVCGVVNCADAQEKVVIKLGHVLAPASHYQATALEFAKLVEQKSHGRIEVQVFPQAQLGGEVQQIQALRTGTQEMMICAQAPMVNTIKQLEIFDIPYLFDSLEESNRVMQGSVGRKFLDMMPAANIIGLAWMSNLERNLFTTKKTVNSLDDMKNLKVRVLQSRGLVAGFKSLGANPTPLAYNQLFLALSQGVVDAADTSPDQFVQDKFIDISKHYYLTHVNYMPIVLAIGKSAWTKLPPDLQKVVQDAATEAAQFDLKEYRRQYDLGLAEIRKAGIDVQSVDTKAWAEATIPARNELIAQVPDGKALYEGIIAAKNQPK